MSKQEGSTNEHSIENELALNLTTLSIGVGDTKIKKLETPFNWDIPKLDNSATVVERTEMTLQFMKDHKNFKWNSFINTMMLSFELYSKEYAKAVQYIKQCENILLAPETKYSRFYVSIKRALWHVLLATKLKFIKEYNADEREKILNKIVPIEDMTNVEKAGIKGIKTAVHMTYGNDLAIIMLDTIREAISLTKQTEPEWHYLEGMILKRDKKINKLFNAGSCLPIFECFKKAYQLDESNASYVYRYASGLKHLAFEQTPNHWTVNRENRYLNMEWKKVVAYHEKALDLEPDCPIHMELLARAYTKFPEPHKNFDKAEQILLRGNKLAPKYYSILLELGKLYEYSRRDDPKKAHKYYIQAFNEGSCGACFHIIQINSYLDRKFCPIDILTTTENRYLENAGKAQCIMEKGCYYLFIKKDLESALPYYNKVLDLYSKIPKIQAYKPSCIHVKKPFSLLELLHHVINTENQEILSNKQKELRRNILDKVYSIIEKPRTVSTAFVQTLLNEYAENRTKYLRSRRKFMHQYDL